MNNRITIAVDFDGTIVYHEFPKIGNEVPRATSYLSAFIEAGADLILWTMRSGQNLVDAVEWCNDRGVKFVGINKNPTQSSWTDSPKAYANIYIDDAAFGCPTKTDLKICKRPFVDWTIVGNDVLKIIHSGATP